MFEISEKRYGLEGFAKTLRHSDVNPRKLGHCTHHLVRKNTVETIVVEGDQPVKALQLVRTHQSMNDWSWALK
jgi:hypothetical protein